MKLFDNVPYSAEQDPMRVLKIWIPERESFPVFVYFHGGGLVNGSRTAGDRFAKWLTDHGIALVSAEYRMYPSVSYPTFIEDAAAAVAWVFSHIGEYGKSEGIFVGGSSAGGYLSMMLCFDPRWLGVYGIRPTDVAGYLHDAGQPTAHFNVLEYDGGVDSRRVIVDERAPLWHIGTAETYPRMHFLVSDNDMQNRYEQTMLMLSTLRHFGCESFTYTVMHGTHCHYCREDQAYDENGDLIIGKHLMRLIYP